MSPCQNFEQDSDSASEEGQLQPSSSRALSAAGSRRQLDSRAYIVPSQRIMEVQELKKAQVWPLLGKKERLAKQAAQSLLDFESFAKGSNDAESDRETQPELEPEAVQADTAAAASPCGSQSHTSRSSSASGFSQLQQRHVAGSSKALKLTSTVIKIVPDAPIESPLQPEAKVFTPAVQLKSRRRRRQQQGASKKQTAASTADPLEEPTNVLLMVTEAPKRQPKQRQSRTPQPRSRSRPPVTRTRTQKQPSSPSYTARPQSKTQTQQTPSSAAVPTPITSKIVRKEQHKVPLTAEDGIDMSYQYFVSIPLKRGQKAQAVRYLYRPMVKSLNPTVRRTSIKRNKKKKGQQTADKSETEEEPQVSPMEAKAEAEPEKELEELTEKPFKVPGLKLDRKYMPMLQMLSQVPFPPETEPKPKSKSKPQSKEDLQEAEKEQPQEAEKQQPQESHGDHQVARTDRTVARSDRQVAKPEIVSSLEGVGDAKPKPKKRKMSIARFRPIRSVLIDYKPEPTRLDSIAGAQISYHAPVRFMRRMEGGEAPKRRSTSPDVCQQQEEEQEQQKEMEKVQRVEKSVSFQLSEATSSSRSRSIRSSSSTTITSSSSSSLTDSSELINSFKLDRPEPTPPVNVAVSDQRKGKKKLVRKNKTKSPSKKKVTK